MVARSIAKMRLQGGRIRRLKRLKRKPMSRTFTAIAGLAALIALSASAAAADENPYSANSMLPACKAVLAAAILPPESTRWRWVSE